MKPLPALQALLFELQKLPGVGPRSARRLAQHILKNGEKDSAALAGALVDLRKKIKKCPRCFQLTEEDGPCGICQDTSRDPEILCVVEQAFDVFRIESCGAFRGFYHVLQGAISPLRRVLPQDLTLEELQSRVAEGAVKELILAIDSDLEGDTTALYILKNLKRDPSLKISRLASGIPFGSDLEYVDDKTLWRAIENRSGF